VHFRAGRRSNTQAHWAHLWHARFRDVLIDSTSFSELVDLTVLAMRWEVPSPYRGPDCDDVDELVRTHSNASRGSCRNFFTLLCVLVHRAHDILAPVNTFYFFRPFIVSQSGQLVNASGFWVG